MKLLASTMQRDDGEDMCPVWKAPSNRLARKHSRPHIEIDTEDSLGRPLVSPPGSGRLHKVATFPGDMDRAGRGMLNSPKMGSTGRLIPLAPMTTVASSVESGAVDGVQSQPGTRPPSASSVRLSPLAQPGLPEDCYALDFEERRRMNRTPTDGRKRGGLPQAQGEVFEEFDRAAGPMRHVPSASRLKGLGRTSSSTRLQKNTADDLLTGSTTPVRSGNALQFRRSGSRAGTFEAGAVSDLSTADSLSSPTALVEAGTQRDRFRAGPSAAVEDEEEPSSLLRRRSMGPLGVSTLRAATGTARGASGLGLATALLAASSAAVPCTKDIIQMAEGDKIFDRYHWDEVLQETGDGGKVVVCQPKVVPDGDTAPWSPSKGCRYVMKMRSKEGLEKDDMTEQFRKAQLRLLNMPRHAGVLPIHEVLEDDKFYYIVMSKADGGAFFPALLSEFGDGVMPASAVRKVIKEIIEAIGHVHSQGMLHRDVKPDNLVFQACVDPLSPSGKAYKVALIDFDHADPEFDPVSPTQSGSWCGTVRFSAPETFLGNFSQASDLYSVGVILYMLLAGAMPYDDAMFEEVLDHKRQASPGPRRYNWRGAVFQRMKETSINWNCEPWPSQPTCLDFCQRLLSFDVNSRISSSQKALLHPWFQAD